MSIVTIIIVLVVIGILGFILEWIRDNIVPILIVVAIILGLIFLRKPTMILFGVALGCIIVFFIFEHVIIPVMTSIHTGLEKRNEIGKANKEKKLEEKKKRAEIKEKEREEAIKLEALPDNIKEFLKVSQECIEELNSEKNDITNKDMLLKINDCQEVIREICSEVEHSQVMNSNLNKLIVYYYPIMCKLVKKYSAYEKRSSDENNVKDEIINTMGEINVALKTIHNRIVHYDDLDVLSDISVVKQMIDRDGLNEGIIK